MRPQRTRAGEPALNLVVDEYRADFIAAVAERGEESVGSGVDAAFALDGLDDHPCGIRRDVRGQLIGGGVEGDGVEAGEERGKGGLVFGIRGCGKGAEGAAVEGVGEREDLVFVRVGRVYYLGVFLRELDGRFVGLSSRIRDECFGCGGHAARFQGCFDQEFAQRARPGVMVEVRGVDQGFGLRGDDLRDGRVAVAEGVDGDARGEVEVASVFDVPDVAALAFDHHGRWAHVGRDHVLGVVFDKGGGGRVGRGVMVGKASFSLRWT